MNEDRERKKGKLCGHGSPDFFLLCALTVAVGILGGCGVDSMALDPALINPEHVRNYMPS